MVAEVSSESIRAAECRNESNSTSRRKVTFSQPIAFSHPGSRAITNLPSHLFSKEATDISDRRVTSFLRSARQTTIEVLRMSRRIFSVLSSLFLLFRALAALAACRIALAFLLTPLRVAGGIVTLVRRLSAFVLGAGLPSKAQLLENRTSNESVDSGGFHAGTSVNGKKNSSEELSERDHFRLSSSSLEGRSSSNRLWDDANLRKWVEEARAVAKLASAVSEEGLVANPEGRDNVAVVAATHREVDREPLRRELLQAKAECDALRQELEQERVLSDSLRRELEQERAAADSAAMASMELIRRLQDDKAADQLAARQRERILVERARYEEDEVEGLREDVERQGEEIRLLREHLTAVAVLRAVTTAVDDDCAKRVGHEGAGERDARIAGETGTSSSAGGEDEEGSERGARIYDLDDDGDFGNVDNNESHCKEGGGEGLQWSKRGAPPSLKAEGGIEWEAVTGEIAAIDQVLASPQDVSAFLAALLEAPLVAAGDAVSLTRALHRLLTPLLSAANAANTGLLAYAPLTAATVAASDVSAGAQGREGFSD